MEEKKARFSDIGNSLVLTFEPLINYIRNHIERMELKKVAKQDDFVYGIHPSVNLIKDDVCRRPPQRFLNEIVMFLTKLRDSVGETNCNNFVNNMGSLKIRGFLFQPSSPLNLPTKFSEFYSSRNNELLVKVGKDYDVSSLLDGLMSVACNNIRTGGVMGFNYKYNDRTLGTSLTNGYISLLNSRMFYDQGYRPIYSDKYFVWRRTPVNDNHSPDPEVNVNIEHCIAGLLEDIVGKERMQEYFFSAKPEAFAKEVLPEFECIDSEEKVRKFLSSLDSFPNHHPEKCQELIFTMCKWFATKYLKKGVQIPSVDLFNFKSKIPQSYFDGNVLRPINTDAIFIEAKNQASMEYSESLYNRTGFTRATESSYGSPVSHRF